MIFHFPETLTPHPLLSSFLNSTCSSCRLDNSSEWEVISPSQECMDMPESVFSFPLLKFCLFNQINHWPDSKLGYSNIDNFRALSSHEVPSFHVESYWFWLKLNCQTRLTFWNHHFDYIVWFKMMFIIFLSKNCCILNTTQWKWQIIVSAKGVIWVPGNNFLHQNY